MSVWSTSISSSACSRRRSSTLNQSPGFSSDAARSQRRIWNSLHLVAKGIARRGIARKERVERQDRANVRALQHQPVEEVLAQVACFLFPARAVVAQRPVVDGWPEQDAR